MATKRARGHHTVVSTLSRCALSHTRFYSFIYSCRFPIGLTVVRVCVELARLIDVFTRSTAGRIRCLLSTTHPLILEQTTAAEKILGVFLAPVLGVIVELLSASSTRLVACFARLSTQRIASVVKQRAQFEQLRRTIVHRIGGLRLSEETDVLYNDVDLNEPINASRVGQVRIRTSGTPLIS